MGWCGIILLLLWPIVPKHDPTPAPPRPVCLYRWDDPDSGVWYYTVGDNDDDSRPWEHTWDAFAGVSEGPCWRLRMRYKIPMTRLGRQAQERAWKRMRYNCDPIPCFPGEWPGE
jgi:hypothetical protein